MSMPCTPAKYKPFLGGEKHKPALTRYQSILKPHSLLPGVGYLHFVTPATLGYLKKIDNQRTTGSGYLKNFRIKASLGPGI
jgi:hypothetical protein